MTDQVARDFAQKCPHVRAMLCAAREEYSNIVLFRVEFNSVEAAKIRLSLVESVCFIVQLKGSLERQTRSQRWVSREKADQGIKCSVLRRFSQQRCKNSKCFVHSMIEGERTTQQNECFRSSQSCPHFLNDEELLDSVPSSTSETLSKRALYFTLEMLITITLFCDSGYHHLYLNTRHSAV